MSWQLQGNIKGADGTAVIPDPLVADNAVYIGTDLRITKLDNGGQIEARDDSDVWHIQTKWQETGGGA